MIMRRHTKYKTTLSCHKIKPLTAICFLLLGLFLISETSYVSSESMYGPGLPYVYSHPFTRLQQTPNWNSGGRTVLQDRNGGVQSHLDLEASGESENNRIDLQGESSNPSKRAESINGGVSHTFTSQDMVNRNSGALGGAEEAEKNWSDQMRQSPSFEMQHWHQRILPPKEILFPKQFLQTTKTFNQPNGRFIGEFSTEPDRNTRGLLNTFNDYEVPSKQSGVKVVRPSQFLLVGNPLNYKRNSVTGREGYMCHFKLCQLGASGKRRWSPVFEYD